MTDTTRRHALATAGLAMLGAFVRVFIQSRRERSRRVGRSPERPRLWREGRWRGRRHGGFPEGAGGGGTRRRWNCVCADGELPHQGPPRRARQRHAGRRLSRPDRSVAASWQHVAGRRGAGKGRRRAVRLPPCQLGPQGRHRLLPGTEHREARAVSVVRARRGRQLRDTGHAVGESVGRRRFRHVSLRAAPHSRALRPAVAPWNLRGPVP